MGGLAPHQLLLLRLAVCCCRPILLLSHPNSLLLAVSPLPYYLHCYYGALSVHNFADKINHRPLTLTYFYSVSKKHRTFSTPHLHLSLAIALAYSGLSSLSFASDPFSFFSLPSPRVLVFSPSLEPHHQNNTTWLLRLRVCSYISPSTSTFLLYKKCLFLIPFVSLITFIPRFFHIFSCSHSIPIRSSANNNNNNALPSRIFKTNYYSRCLRRELASLLRPPRRRRVCLIDSFQLSSTLMFAVPVDVAFLPCPLVCKQSLSNTRADSTINRS